MKIKTAYKLVLPVMVFMALALLTRAMQERFFHQPQKAKKMTSRSDSLDKKIVYDPVLVKRFEQLSTSLNQQQNRFTYAGVINVTDGADTSNNIRHLDFVICRDGGRCYAKTGPAETYNGQGVYLYLEHNSKRAIISSEKKMSGAVMPDMSKLTDNLQNEHYQLQSVRAGRNEVLRMVNEHHISCKEYALTFDTLSHKVSRIYVRMTNLRWPMDRSKEKVMDIRVSRFDKEANVNAYINIQQMLHRSGKNWQLSGAYRNYELIRLP